MIKALGTLYAVANTGSTKEKKAILLANDSPVLRSILKYTYDPFLTYRIKQLDIPTKFNNIEADVSVELFQLLDLLANHKTTPTEARGMVKRLMAKCTKELAGLVERIIDRDLKIGCGVTTINEVFPKLIPFFGVMLAEPMIEPKSGESNWHRVKYPACFERKADGTRVIAVCDGVTVRFYSREGLEKQTLDHLIPQILSMRPGSKFVLDGESVGVVYNPNCKSAKKHYDAGKNWQFAQGIAMTNSKKGKYPEEDMKRCLGYYVWDIIDYDYFTTQGEVGTCKPLKYRKTELAGIRESLAAPLPSIQFAETVIINNQEEAIAYFKALVAAGEEGAMYKDLDSIYEFRRTFAMIKLKEFYSADLRIEDCFEGTKGTKNEGSLGTMLVSDGEITGKVMGGWDEDLGLNIWLRHLKGQMKGRIVEVLYKEITTDNNMRHCIFVRERYDKTTTSRG